MVFVRDELMDSSFQEIGIRVGIYVVVENGKELKEVGFTTDLTKVSLKKEKND